MSCRANQKILDAAIGKTVDQIIDLPRTPIQMTAGFDMQDLHAEIIIEPAESRTQ